MSVVWVVLAYLLGSVSFAIVFSRLAGMADPRSYGSNNPGATNVLRSGNKKLALLTLLGDGLKGTLAVWVALRWGNVTPLVAAWVACAVVLGHMFPVFHGFAGGKGVATIAGTVLALDGTIFVMMAVVWFAVAAVFRYSSLAALSSAAFGLLMFASYWGVSWPLVPMVLMMGIMAYRHRANIAKLRAGTEGKLFARS